MAKFLIQITLLIHTGSKYFPEFLGFYDILALCAVPLALGNVPDLWHSSLTIDCSCVHLRAIQTVLSGFVRRLVAQRGGGRVFEACYCVSAWLAAGSLGVPNERNAGRECLGPETTCML
jgi:hypothetical protein